MAKPRILLIGLGPTTLSALQSLITRFEVIGVIRDGGEDSVSQLAHELNVPVIREVTPKEVAAFIKNAKPDCVVVSSYNRLLSSELIGQCPFVNVHYAPLPRYRGRANVNWAIINDEPHAAISIHELVAELDAGNVLFQQLIPIDVKHTVTDLYEELNGIQRDQLANTVERFLDGERGVPQIPLEATYGCSRIPADGEIDWSQPAQAIARMIRALTVPFPGAFTYYDGRKLFLWKADVPIDSRNYEGRIPGRVVEINKAEGHVDVLAGDGVIRLIEVQFEDEPKTSAAAVVRSVRDTLGLRTAELLERIRILEQKIEELTVGERKAS